MTSPLSPSRLNYVRPSSHYRKPGPQKDPGRQPDLRETRESTWRTSLELARRRAIKLTSNKLHGKCGMCATKEASADSRWMSFLTAGQIQSFFSRPAANLRHAVAPEDDDEETDDNSQAAEEEEAFLDARNTILVQCVPVHAIVYDTWKLCAMSSSNKLSSKSPVAGLPSASHFNMEDEPSGHRKKPYLDFISELVGACSCASSNQ